MEISRYYRNKLSAIGFLSIIMVLLIHSHYVEGYSYPVAKKVQMFCGTSGLSVFAVPMFFAISGFLFFNNVNHASDCSPKIRKRLKTLLVPFLLWSVIFILIYALMQALPQTQAYVNDNVVSHIPWSRPLEALGYILLKPAAFHLWFLRDLILFVLISPLLYTLISRWPWLCLLAAFILGSVCPRFGLVYFILGGVVALRYSLESLQIFLSEWVCIAMAVVYIGNAILQAYPTWVWPGAYSTAWTEVTSICGMGVVWRLYDSVKVRSFEIFNYTFFIYLFHEPTFNVVKKLSLRIVGESDATIVVLYFLNVAAMLLIAYCVGKLMKRMLPRMYAVLCGGR